jgi:hypothetical protein
MNPALTMWSAIDPVAASADVNKPPVAKAAPDAIRLRRVMVFMGKIPPQDRRCTMRADNAMCINRTGVDWQVRAPGCRSRPRWARSGEADPTAFSEAHALVVSVRIG